MPSKTAKTTKKTKTTSKTTRKTARTAKKPAGRTTRTASTGRTGSGPAAKAAAAKTRLLDTLGSLGLLDTATAESLTGDAGKIDEGTLGKSLERAAGWDGVLQKALAEYDAAGGDGRTANTTQALVTWQKSLDGLPADRAGVEKAITGLRKVLGFTGATVFLRDTEASRVRPYVSVGFEVDLISRIRFTEGDGFSSWVATRRKPILYGALHRNEAPRDDQVRSFIAVPLVVGESCVGVLTLGHNEPDTFGPQQLRLAIVAGSIVAGLVLKTLADRQIAEREITHRLTGFYTRSHLRARLEEEVVRGRELGYSMSVIKIRLEELAGHVDRFGDDYRTRTLDDLRTLLAEWRKPTELVGHDEGDTLVAILPGDNGMRATERARALAELLEKHSFPRRKRMTARVGVASYPADAEEAQDLLGFADKALDGAARSGGDRIVQFPTAAAS
jgi:diguanylate cyclase (GGDEF)-like protein